MLGRTLAFCFLASAAFLLRTDVASAEQTDWEVATDFYSQPFTADEMDAVYAWLGSGPNDPKYLKISGVHEFVGGERGSSLLEVVPVPTHRQNGLCTVDPQGHQVRQTGADLVISPDNLAGHYWVGLLQDAEQCESMTLEQIPYVLTSAPTGLDSAAALTLLENVALMTAAAGAAAKLDKEQALDELHVQQIEDAQNYDRSADWCVSFWRDSSDEQFQVCVLIDTSELVVISSGGYIHFRRRADTP